MTIKIKPRSRTDAGLGQVLAGWVLATLALAAPALVQAKDAPIPPGAVLSVMENIPLDDQADTGELENGAVATFWYGHELDLDGKHYYTAFVWHTRDSAARQGEDFAAPEVQVRLAQATFERTHPGQAQAYTLRYIERKIGFFGAREKPEDVDPARPALEHRTTDGRLLLAVPTSSFDSGVIFKGYTLFAFNPKKTEDDTGWIWSFVGQVRTGEDNSAACDEGAVMPCTFSKGDLSFVDDQGPMPQVKVTVSGTTFDGPDSTRPLAAADNVTYVYDGQKREYISNN